MLNVLPLDSRRREQRRWIIHATCVFVGTIKYHTNDDIRAAVVTADENFSNGESGARSIYRGYDYARQRIAERQAEQNNVIRFDFR